MVKSVKSWSGRRDSNPRPRPWQGRAPARYWRAKHKQQNQISEAQTAKSDQKKTKGHSARRYWPKAHDDEVHSFVELSLDTPLSALPQFVQEATHKLFAAFDGAKIPRATIE